MRVKVLALLFLVVCRAGLIQASETIAGVEVLSTIEELVDPDRCAVVCIDMQNENILSDGQYYADVPGWKRSSPKSESPRISNHFKKTHDIRRHRAFLDAARSTGVTVIYVEIFHLSDAHDGVELMFGVNKVCKNSPKRWWSRTIDELAPQEGEIIIYKPSGDSFEDTPLDQILRARGIESVLLTGTATNGCVLATTWGAEFHGYYPVIIEDLLNRGTAKECVNARRSEPSDDPPGMTPGAFYERAICFMESRYPTYHSNEVIAVWNDRARSEQKPE